MFVRNRWDSYSYTSFPPNKDGKMVHFGFCAVSSMIWGCFFCGGGGGGCGFGDFSFWKDLVRYAAQILLFNTPELFRRCVADIPLPLVWNITLPLDKSE